MADLTIRCVLPLGIGLALTSAGCSREQNVTNADQPATAEASDSGTDLLKLTTPDPAKAYDGQKVVFNNSYTHGPPPPIPAPAWAFAMDPPESAEYKPMPGDDEPRQVPGSNLRFSRTDVLKHLDVIDWHPDNHPAAPPVVMMGRAPQPAACAFCHLPNGRGAPENAPLAGLPVNYFIRQVLDFQSKARKSADMRMASYHGMADYIAPRTHRDEIVAAARYYASFPLTPYIKVIETDKVPKTKSIGYTMLRVPGGGTEPIGNRIIETPADERRFHLNDSEGTYLSYVPLGSIALGKAIVTTGGGKTTACVSCHGQDLGGTDDIPPLAGRGPSNLVRQIYNFRVRARTGDHAKQMYPVVDKLNDKDIVDVVAYLASLPPAKIK